MKRWYWVLNQVSVTLGLPGLLGLAMLIAAGAVYVGSVQPNTREIANLKQQLSRMPSHPQLDRQYTPSEELALFYNFFPARDELAEQLRTLNRLAVDQELTIERVDYKLSHIMGTPLWRYQVSFPLNTDYTSLRHYIADVLKALPNAALENIELQRADADAELLDEKIGLVLFYRESP
jgi:Tfp pilus assembly protein PilO